MMRVRMPSFVITVVMRVQQRFHHLQPLLTFCEVQQRFHHLQPLLTCCEVQQRFHHLQPLLTCCESTTTIPSFITVVVRVQDLNEVLHHLILIFQTMILIHRLLISTLLMRSPVVSTNENRIEYHHL
ncbi:unnamed protein product [Rhizophagus irregularis]|nr:unnamed protein product [Rhizophagus irregularis]